MVNSSIASTHFQACLRSATGRPTLTALDIDTIQVNIGLRCNLACHHCHVQSSPWRSEAMTWETMTQVIDLAKTLQAGRVDITGGAPELHPHFRVFIEALRAAGRSVMVRTNLTVLLLPEQQDLPQFFQDHQVHLVASLPCYLETNVDTQRGAGVFQESLAALCHLNERGYGRDAHLPLDLVYNPAGPHLPPPQDRLEQDYRRILSEQYGIVFTRLYTLANMPIGRFWGQLKVQGEAEAYQEILLKSFNPETLPGLMCRHQVNIRWDGTLFDCDFNLALNLPAGRLGEWHPEQWRQRLIRTGDHCLGCTAGRGSSCSGALVVESGRSDGIRS
ncbi:MAG: arsenosugar biosynthesis radical SAM protein ArsS [Gloeomargaritaceae cyanobacterium C42_A2020_066]|nr:arsenosugar biosynthesis radical SAM protein ArsS [Gloeomargaritaceae cyanobacterium C42_A2020_066]